MIEILPPVRLGPVEVGVTMEEAEIRLSGLTPGSVGEGQGQPRGSAQFDNGLTIRVSPGTGGRVDAIQAYRPLSPIRLDFRGVDLFAAPAHEVERSVGALVETTTEEDGSLFIAPDMLLALWRPFVADSPEEEEGYYFQSALVARPGYYG